MVGRIRVLVVEVKATRDIADELGQYNLPVIAVDRGGRRVRGVTSMASRTLTGTTECGGRGISYDEKD